MCHAKKIAKGNNSGHSSLGCSLLPGDPWWDSSLCCISHQSYGQKELLDHEIWPDAYQRHLNFTQECLTCYILSFPVIKLHYCLVLNKIDPSLYPQQKYYFLLSPGTTSLEVKDPIAACILQNKAGPATYCKIKQGQSGTYYSCPHHVVLGFAPLLSITVSELLRHNIEFNMSEII